jgi:transposase InsO family protein
MIAMDLIVDLPESSGFDSILTITDHDCTKAAIFLPCNQMIDAPEVVELYAKHVFPHYRAPKKIILDRDPRFTANFTQELCRLLEIKQNLSTAYHPQTDGQSECTNQWLEQYLRIYGNYQQDNWADWLPMAQFVYNSWPSATTGKMPFELLMGHMPQLPDQPLSTPILSLGERQTTLEHVREQAQCAIRAAQNAVE